MIPKKIDINGIKIPIIIGNRALIDFKRDTGRSNVNDVEDVLRMAWHGLKSGAKLSNLEFKMSFEEWVDYTDAHPEIDKELKSNEPEQPADSEDKKKATT